MSKTQFSINSIHFLDVYNQLKIKLTTQGQADNIIQNSILPNQRRYQEIALLVREELNRPSMYRWPLFPSAKPSIPVEERIKINRTSHGLPETPPDSKDGKSNPLSLELKRRINGKPMMSFDTLGAIIPWYFIALVHYRESGNDFSRHLHNGDSLKNFTRKVPAHRPYVLHAPPFSFEESAVDALIFQGKKDGWNDHWDLKNVLIRLEKYNGFGYEMYHGVNSPYLWGGSDFYSKGAYLELKENNYKTKWYGDKISDQVGTAVILKRMEQLRKVTVIKS
ncbi:hypothetical protein [Pedobacter sp. WC2423]|uniref:hypothetical protein n=1 Tax=Pedobacter sp. WC2423 TaxID=3234142 RepID=UPI0034668EC8